MQLTKWVHEPIWISKVKIIHWPWSKVAQIQHFQTSFPEKPLGRLKPNFIWSLDGGVERKFVQMVQVTWPRWLPCQYGKKHEKFFFSATKRPMTLKVCVQHRVLEYYQICSNDESRLNVTYFTARSNLVPYAFVWEKLETMDFSETVVVYDVKIGRCSQRNKYMKLYEYQRSRSLIDLGPNLSDSVQSTLFIMSVLVPSDLWC